VLLYLTTRATCAEWKDRRPFLVCEERQMDRFFWHLLPTRDLPAYNTTTLHPHTPLNIIGVADVAFNRLCSCHVFCHGSSCDARTMGTWLVYMHHLILLYNPHIHLSTRSHTNYVPHSDLFDSSTLHAILPRIIFFNSHLLCITPLGCLHSCTCNDDAIIIWAVDQFPRCR
jgi:hypothetical protein